jgi:hypothetical protein
MPHATLFKPRPGALRFTDAQGRVQEVNPRDMMYSTVSMLATEFWDGVMWKAVKEIEK